MYRRYIKRILDILLSALGLALLSPLFLIIAVWIRLDSPGKVFFCQQRIGRDLETFPILKFRTMRSDTPHDMPTHMLENPDAYITKSGAFLRKTSLDELPQMINILKGDMSVVGPRPALWNQDDLIAEREKYGANSVRPGLTGLAQISGRDELPIPVKARLDGEYVKNLSFATDARCFFRTIGAVARSEGVVEGAARKPSKSSSDPGPRR